MGRVVADAADVAALGLHDRIEQRELRESATLFQNERILNWISALDMGILIAHDPNQMSLTSARADFGWD